MTPAMDMEELRSLLGREFVFTAPEEIGQASIRKFALAIGDTSPLYLDEAYARSTSYGGIIAPPTFVCETMQYFRGELKEDGTFEDQVNLPLSQFLRGGNEYTFYRPLRPEDVLTVRWKLADVYEREGRSGRLAFAVAEITYTNQRGELLAVNRETLVQRLPPRVQ